LGRQLRFIRRSDLGSSNRLMKNVWRMNLSIAKIFFERQVALPVTYKSLQLDCGYRLDFLVEKTVILELKAVDGLEPIHEAQLLTYLKLGGWPIGLLINFNVPVLKKGIKRMVHNLRSPL